MWQPPPLSFGKNAPVYVDIDPLTLNTDPSKIEAAITPNTSAILATHVYGNPCDVEAIQRIADKYGLKVIYDGANAFGVKVIEKSTFKYAKKNDYHQR
jgi:dTDP-4-amino-4,6-dideoxygalactose transaminase